MKRKILREIKYQLPHKFIVPKRIPQETESEGEEEEEMDSPSSLGDNKPPSLWTFIPPSFSSFGNTTPRVEFPALGKPVPSFGTSSH